VKKAGAWRGKGLSGLCYQDAAHEVSVCAMAKVRLFLMIDDTSVCEGPSWFF